MSGRNQTGKRRTVPRRAGRTEKIRGLREGQVRSTVPVTVEAGAIVASDVVAPQVTVRGVVRGRVVAYALKIEPGGQVLGDVWVELLAQKAGGDLRGWVSSLTPPYLAMLENEAAFPVRQAAPRPDLAHAPTLDALRNELAAEVLARKTIERELDGRIALATAESEARVKSLDQMLAASRNAHGQLQEQLEAAAEREQAVNRALQDAHGREEALREAIAGLDDELADMTGRRDQAVALTVEQRQEVVALKQDLEDRQQRIDRLIDDLAKANQLAGNRHRQIELRDAEAKKLDERIRDLVNQLAAVRNEVRERDRLLDELGDNLVQSQEHVEQQHYEVLDLRQQIEGLKNQIAEGVAEVEEARAVRLHAEQSLQRQESEILRLRTELDVSLAELDQDRADLAREREQIAKRDERIAELQTRLANEAGAHRELAVVKGQLDQARKLAEAQRSLAETRAETASKLQTEVERLKRHQRVHQMDLTAGQQRVLELEEAHIKAREQIRDLEIDLQATNDHIAALKDERDRKAEQSRRVLRAARLRVTEMQKQVEKAQNEFARAQEQAVAWRGEAERHEKELRASRDQAAQQRGQAESDLKMAQSVIAQLNDEIGRLEELIDDRNQRIAQLYAELAETRTAIMDLESAAQEQLAQIAELELQTAARHSELELEKKKVTDLMAWIERKGVLTGEWPTG